MPSSIVKQESPSNKKHYSYPSSSQQQPNKKVVDDKEEEEEVSDISDTELQLVKILNTFTKGKGKEHGGLSLDEYKAIEKTIPFGTEVRLKRLARENIRLITSEMTSYLMCHEFKVRGSAGRTYVVTVGPKLDCTCRDHKVRGTHCKHILFVLLEELKVTDLTNRVYVTLYPSNEILKQIFLKYHPTI